MRVLVACEFSGIVRDAFAKLGHDAWSCDLLPSERPGQHIQGDVLDILGDGWDMMLAFPPCTYLCSSGLHWNHRRPGRAAKTEEALDFIKQLLDADIPAIALENPVGCINTRIRKPDQAVHPWQFGENASKKTCLWLKGLPKLQTDKSRVVPPKGWETVICADETVACDCCCEPWCPIHENHYSDCPCIGPTEDEAAYIEIEGCLFGTRTIPPPRAVWGNQTPSGQNKLGPSKDRWKLRSVTYQGIAEAMAEQWTTWSV
jgi:hypothetical protein